MSQENVEIVRAAIEAFNGGDWGMVFTVGAPDAEVDLSRAVGLARGVYSREEWANFLDEFSEHWQSARIEPDEFIQGDDHVVVRWTMSVVGRGGIEVEARVYWTWTIREGRVQRITYYPTRTEALEAAGLSE